MKKTLLIALSLSSASVAQVASFDALVLDFASYWNGSDLSGVYVEEGFTSGNYYDTAWYSWSGFSVSSITDNDTAGWGNQYGVSAGSANSGNNFAVATMGASISSEERTIDYNTEIHLSQYIDHKGLYILEYEILGKRNRQKLILR